MTHTPTVEQEAIYAAATETEDNLLISALAGAAKTSTLVELSHRVQVRAGLCVAFNKKIADELKQRMPGNFECKTLNALGHAAWADKVGKRLRVNKSKMYEILTSVLDDFEHTEPKLAEEARENFSLILRTLGQAKSGGHIPDYFNKHFKKAPARLMDDQELFDSMEEEIDSTIFREVILVALEKSARQAFEGNIDFADQLLMPAVFGGLFPRYPLVLVDEAQDLSALNHLLLERFVKKRIIAVGDQCQAIYAFRGAYEDGMQQMRERWHMVEMPLSISFRCPEVIVKHVQWRAPHMQAWKGNTTLSILRHMAIWDPTDIPEGAAIICRNNAPLLSMGMRLFKQGIYPNIWGNDIAAGLLGQLEKLGPANMTKQQVLEAIADWQDKKSKTVRNQKLLADKTECLRILAGQGDTLADAIEAGKALFNSKGRVHLMTGHKSKGHEFLDVFFLDEELVTDEGQDQNLRYVICTRSQCNLTYIKSDGWADNELEYF